MRQGARGIAATARAPCGAGDSAGTLIGSTLHSRSARSRYRLPAVSGRLATGAGPRRGGRRSWPGRAGSACSAATSCCCGWYCIACRSWSFCSSNCWRSASVRAVGRTMKSPAGVLDHVAHLPDRGAEGGADGRVGLPEDRVGADPRERARVLHLSPRSCAACLQRLAARAPRPPSAGRSPAPAPPSSPGSAAGGSAASPPAATSCPPA